jgi:asparagine synthase (glutamine-hydrolysing)
MAHSLEVRVPFIDPTVVDFALSIPPEAKLGSIDKIANASSRSYRATGAKRILIDSVRDLLPQDIDVQTKHGFGMPFGHWLNGPLRDVLEDALSEKSVRLRGLFDEKAVTSIKAEFLRDQSDWSRPWLLMITELWCRQVLDGRQGLSDDR